MVPQLFCLIDLLKVNIDILITAVTQETKSFGKPWKTLAPVGPFLRHLKRAKVVASFRLTIGYDFLGAYLHWSISAWLRKMPAPFAAMPEWMSTTCSNALESMDTEMTSGSEALRQIIKKPSTGIG
ncbi:hypothetical protein TNCV_107321 [Trichonephila clavipes]|nr:hypothetical protein TNCV_107321 [Trichonephila clavipes]